jgi:hypothetical protein
MNRTQAEFRERQEHIAALASRLSPQQRINLALKLVAKGYEASRMQRLYTESGKRIVGYRHGLPLVATYGQRRRFF